MSTALTGVLNVDPPAGAADDDPDEGLGELGAAAVVLEVFDDEDDDRLVVRSDHLG